MTTLRAVLDRCLRRLPTAAPDAALLRAYAADGDADAFRALVERHGPMVLRLCRRLLGDAHAAEDAFQATFLALARQAGSLRRPERLAAWLFGTARRVALKARVAEARRRRHEARAAPRPAADPHHELTARELLAALDEEVGRLPERYRLPLLLVYWQGLTQTEAAQMLGWSPSSVKGRLERGRARLADRLARRGFAPGAVLLAPLAAAVVPADLLARTAALATDPWARTLPAAVVALLPAAGLLKIVPAAALSVLLAGAGVLALGLGAPRPNETPKTDPPPPAATGPRVDRYGDPLPDRAVLRLGTLRYGTDGRISHISVRPGGRIVAFSTGLSVTFMDVQTGQTVRRIGRVDRTVNGRQRYVILTALAMAPDGRTFAVGCRDEPPSPAPFWLCDATTGERLREFAGHDKQVQSLAFLAGGRQLASFGDDGVVRVWDTATGAKLRELTGPDRKLTSLAVSADGLTIATGAAARDGTAAVYLWDAMTGQLRRTLAGHTADVKAVAFAPDGRTLASGGNAIVRLWDTASGRELRQFHGHPKEGLNGFRHFLHTLAFSPDGRTLAAVGTDWTARVWSVATGQSLDTVAPSISEEDALTFLDDRTLLIGGGWKLLIRDVRDRAFSERFTGPAWPVVALAFTPDGRTLATVDGSSEVRTWEAMTGRPLSGRAQRENTTVASPDARLVAITGVGTANLTVRIDELATGRTVQRLPGADHFVVAFSPDGRRLATFVHWGDKKEIEGTIRVWDVTSGAKLCEFTAGNMSPQAVTFSPDGRSLFTGASGKPVQQWDVATGRVVKEYPAARGVPQNRGLAGANHLAVSAGGRRLAVSYHDGTLRLWDVVNGQECWRAEIKAERSAPWPEVVALSPDGSLLAAGYNGRDEGQIDFWDARTGQHLTDLRGHGSGCVVSALAFSPDGRRLASGSSDCTALVWDVEAITGRRVGGPPDGDRLWDDLAGPPAAAAHAIDCWQAAPPAAVAFLRGKLRPVAAVPAERVAALVARLDGPAFADREQASKDLTFVGPGAEPALRRALEQRPSAEARRQIEAALTAWDDQHRRTGHALEILETVATPDARKLLADLANGDSAVRLTQEAKASLERLRRR
jgi:RNA polymerase sigma factor (sigma-70 family)